MIEETDILTLRMELAKGRMQEIVETESDFELLPYFKKQFSFCLFLFDLYEKFWLPGTEAISDAEVISDAEAMAGAEHSTSGPLGWVQKTDLHQLRERNKALYQDILPENYDTSYCNPDYAAKTLGEYAGVLCVAAAEMRAMIGACYENRLEELLIRAELMLELFGAFEEEMPSVSILQDILYWYVSDYMEVIMERRVASQVNPKDDYFTGIVMRGGKNSSNVAAGGYDLSDTVGGQSGQKPEDIRYLYAYGEYVTENEEKMAEYLSRLPEEKIGLIADTFTEGYRIGFVLGRKDLSKKKTVNIRYHVGFERIIRRAVLNFEKMGLRPTIYRQASSILEGKSMNRIGVYGGAANRQFDYDHKEDMGLILDKKLVSRKLEILKNAYEAQKDWASLHAGPAVMETFGEADFTPENKETSVKLSEKQQHLTVEYASGAGQITNEYIKGEERSFTIIAFPVPDIGEKFPEIFDETIRINTLDYNLYRDMQQKIIDVLDQGEYVQIRGMGENKTRMKVMLHTLQDPEKQTNFENCVADVNIPVGEVFTSPVLAGTEGTLHVSKVFLNELKYEDLELHFEDGMITSYSCRNFESEEENQKLIRDTVLFHHDTLPLGEFAIGTNTTAYVAAERLQIADKLPILIAEKMGPHFAVGDTCYSHAEDIPVYNPDGKEIIARDNEKSLLRKEKPEKAYFNCHTDITIPYDELGEVSVVRKDGKVIPILEEGRFVLDGCEALNEPFAG